MLVTQLIPVITMLATYTVAVLIMKTELTASKTSMIAESIDRFNASFKETDPLDSYELVESPSALVQPRLVEDDGLYLRNASFARTLQANDGSTPPFQESCASWRARLTSLLVWFWKDIVAHGPPWRDALHPERTRLIVQPPTVPERCWHTVSSSTISSTKSDRTLREVSEEHIPGADHEEEMEEEENDEDVKQRLAALPMTFNPKSRQRRQLCSIENLQSVVI
ncbi:hypothetical protein EST38_g8937 [Candolleomyces aberdarensis]|uniref:Uncharacterized protein n=1 Tax=Candolleomyces aberdarensis TaxID=2316362 RepID=A0A4V1Q306_9AGAR|nr:hypothetical protein EST38_g8937 [Candolleomyces aberdarensis]